MDADTVKTGYDAETAYQGLIQIGRTGAETNVRIGAYDLQRLNWKLNFALVGVVILAAVELWRAISG